MDSKFVPPTTKEEFLERAKKVPLAGALGVLNSLKQRRASMVRALDQEILFYEKVVELNKVGEDAVEWGDK
jgi:protein tyrosine phosphatase